MVETLFFVLLSFFFFYQGYVFWKERNIYNFFKWVAMLPLTSSLAAIHTKYQINVYYTFVIIPIIFYVLEEFMRKRASKTVLATAFSSIMFVTFFLVYAIFFNAKNITITNILKDIKPIIFLTFGFVLLDILKNNQLNWDGFFARKILKYNFFASLIWFFLLENTGLINILSNDPYYNLTETRYSAVSTSYVLIYFVSTLASKRKVHKLDLLYILTPIFLTGNRTSFLILGVLYLINMFLSANDINLFLKRTVLFVSGGLVLVLGVFNFNAQLKQRILSVLDLNLVYKQLTENRFAPFITEIDTFKWYNYIFGKGIGETIFIPWFAYRENIDNENIYMDNIYLTLYIKYGIFSILLILLLFYFVSKTNTNRRFKILMVFYFIGMGATTAFMYQTNFLFVLLVLASFKFTKTDYELESNI